jgi:hypothetical protein
MRPQLLTPVQNPNDQSSTTLNFAREQALFELGQKSAAQDSLSLWSLIVLSLVILVGGFLILYQITDGRLPFQKGRDPAREPAILNPLRPHSLQVLGLTFILPVLLIVSVSLKLPSEAITALLGAIIGSIFGSTQKADFSSRNSTRFPSPGLSNGPGSPEPQQNPAALIQQFADERLRQASVDRAWTPMSAIRGITLDATETDASVTVQQLLGIIKEVTRVPVFENTGAIRYVIHEGMIYKFIADHNGLEITEAAGKRMVTLADFIARPDPSQW